MRKKKTGASEGRGPSASGSAGVDPAGIAHGWLVGSACPGRIGRRRTARALVCLLLISAFQAGSSASYALAKKKKEVPRTISGRVLDEADNGISGALVELTDLQTGKKAAIFSEEGGRYQFSDLELTHDYEVKAGYKGTSSETRKASSLGERQAVLNLRIPPQTSDK
jgi:hypothetical protein